VSRFPYIVVMAKNAPRIIVVMPEAVLAQVEDVRFKHRLLSRTAAILKLLEIGLQHIDDDEPPPAREAND
jgi:hypothetical protein